MNVLALSGSLRTASTNAALLEAVRLLAPPGMTVRAYDGLGSLPHFNPDLDVEPWPEPVIDLRVQIGWADGLIVSSPEYARGIPGAFKNALDWLVSSDVFPGKPVALFNASSRSVALQAALRLTLETMSARMIDAACVTIPLLGGNRAAQEIADNPDMAAPIRDALGAFAAAYKAAATISPSTARS